MEGWKRTLIISSAILTVAAAAAIILGSLGYILWNFSAIFIYLITAIVLTLIGRPIKRLLEKVKIGKFTLPNTFNTIVAMLVIVGFFLALIGFFVPLLVDITDQIQAIDPSALTVGLEEPLKQIMAFNEKYRFFELQEGETLEQVFLENVQEIVNQVNFSSMISGILGLAGNFFVGAFSVAFITFFFLNERSLLQNISDTITPDKYVGRVNSVLEDVRNLLSRYFIGVMLEILLVGGLVALGLGILGIKNALFIGYFAGIFNVIPYLGPIIGGTMTVAMTAINSLHLPFYDQAFPFMLFALAIFFGVQLLDNFLFQPFIYSSSVKAHPLEVFLVILAAGFIGGAGAMVLAIPVYTIVRVFAREFLYKFKIVSSLTKSIDHESPSS
ncbi:MAG: AI-2E family transporter [Bacteroidota bacterium]